MINFKKVVSMVVMLSLMLSACGKSPARRDGGIATDTTEDLKAIEKEKNEFESAPLKRIGAGVCGEAFGAGLGMAVTLTIATGVFRYFGKELFAVRGIVLCSRLCFGLGIVPGGISGGIVEWMSKAAGDGWVKVMLKTGLTGFGMGVAAGIGVTVVSLMTN